MIKSRRLRWAGHIAQMGAEQDSIYDIVGKARRKGSTRKAKT
jgi:hypothetical protein